MDWLTPEIILTIYAACISTIALVWNIVYEILEKSSRIRVIVEFRQALTSSQLGQAIVGPTVLFVRIINKSNTIKYVSNIQVKLPYITSDGNYYSLINQDTIFPIELASQQEYVYKIKLSSPSKILLENFKDGKCFVIVCDTISKKYKSNRFSSSIMKKAIEQNASLSADVMALFRY